MYLDTPAGVNLARRLFQIGAVEFAGPNNPGWRLKLHERDRNAPLSPIYFNLRTPRNPKPSPLIAEVLKMIAAAFQWLVVQSSIRYAGVCGIQNAGVPIVEAFVHHHPIKTIHLTKTSDGESGRRISGVSGLVDFLSGARVLLMDDVITGADTKIEAIEAIRAANLVVSDLLVIIDREQGGIPQVANVKIHSLFSVRKLLPFYLAQGLINQTTYDRVMTYLKLESTTKDSVTKV